MDPLRAILRKGNKDNNAHHPASASYYPVGSGPMLRHVNLTCGSRRLCAHTFTPPDMDYLRSLGTAAVSSIVQKSGLNLPFSLGTKLPPLDALNIWTLYDAVKRVYTFRSTFCVDADSSLG